MRYVAGKQREFMAGLAKGLVLSGLGPIAEAAVIFPFYGNRFADHIERFESGGGQVPVLEVALRSAVGEDGERKEVRRLAKLQADLLNDMVARLNFDPAAELEYLGQDGGFPQAETLGPDDLLRVPFLVGALQFLSRKTSVPAEIIRRHLANAAYYLGRDDMRTLILDVVREGVTAKSRPGDALIVIGHSLGSIVAYDFLASTDDDTLRQRNIRLLVTAGSPLGLPVVKKHLLPKSRRKKPMVQRVPVRPGGRINAYDVTDVAALIPIRWGRSSLRWKWVKSSTSGRTTPLARTPSSTIRPTPMLPARLAALSLVARNREVKAASRCRPMLHQYSSGGGQ
jgi:hypothetical protein